MKGKYIPSCTECRRNTPPLGETVCRRCQASHEEVEQQRDAESEFYSNIDDVGDRATEACLRAIFRLIGGDER